MNRDERLVAFCRELLQLPSLSGQEEQVVRCIERTMQSYGFDQVEIDRYGSIVGTIQGKRPGRTVSIC